MKKRIQELITQSDLWLPQRLQSKRALQKDGGLRIGRTCLFARLCLPKALRNSSNDAMLLSSISFFQQGTAVLL